jgi:hypothetical protein
MQPFSLKSKEVLENFDGSGSNATGVTGTYPLYADAYRQVAKEMGLKPRELQSVVWEWARSNFANMKNEEGLPSAKYQWALSKAGKITPDQARANIANEIRRKQGGKASAVNFLNKIKDNNTGAQAGAEAMDHVLNYMKANNLPLT